MRDPPLALSSKSLKQQRLERASTLLHQHPDRSKAQMVKLIAEELGLDRATVYAYIRQIKRAQTNAASEGDEHTKDNKAATNKATK
jgi:hypothetical protein